MKKVFIVAAMAIFSFTSINAQGVNVGVKAGLNLASITGDDVEDTSIRPSFHVGAIGEFGFSEKFSVQAELLYSSQGAKQDGYAETTKYSSTTKLDYLNLPIMAKYYVISGLSVEAGPQVGYLLNAKGKLDLLGESRNVDLKEYYSSIDYGVNFGVGYKLKNGLSFGARYNLGLANINDSDQSDGTNHNGVIQLSAGFFFF